MNSGHAAEIDLAIELWRERQSGDLFYFLACPSSELSRLLGALALGAGAGAGKPLALRRELKLKREEPG